MILFKSMYFIVPITIFLVFFCGQCLSYPSENVQFITKLAQKNSEDWESDLIEPKLLAGKFDPTEPQLGDDVKNDQDIENTKLLFADEKDEEEKYVKEDINIGRKRPVRQVNYSAHSPIYPTLTPQNPQVPMYRPVTGVHGNIPNNYPSNQNSYSNSGHSQPYYYPQGQNPFQNNSSYTNPTFNQGSFYNNQSSNQQYNSSIGPSKHYFNNHPSVNNSNPPFQGNFPQNGHNANRHTFTPTPTNQWTPGYTTNNSRYNPTASNGVSPKYPSFNNPPNTFHNFNNSTPRNIINGRNGYSPPNPQYNPSNSPYQSYPHNANSQHNNYNGSNQWSSSSSSTQTPYNYPGNNYPYVPNDGRSSNVSRQNYPASNPSSYPTNNNLYNQQPYSPNSLPNPYSQNYPAGPNSNHNNQYNKEPDHFFYSPGQKDTRYDPRNGPSHNFSYT